MPDKYPAIELINNTTAHQFEIMAEGYLSKMLYTRSGNVYNLMHTEVPSVLEGKGIGSSLIEKVFVYLEKNNLKMKPYCPFVRAFLKRHPEWERLRAEE